MGFIAYTGHVNLVLQKMSYDMAPTTCSPRFTVNYSNINYHNHQCVIIIVINITVLIVTNKPEGQCCRAARCSSGQMWQQHSDATQIRRVVNSMLKQVGASNCAGFGV